ncbi:hypothetical protein AB0M22_45430 [Nocardia sp. NPDC051756]|uniref:hypothetical protein n=1 Tax=Nocardia sp. NPDC051756 TaxID=3154751 RepID=UPI003447E7B8
MSSTVFTSATAEFEKALYLPAHPYRYGPDERFEMAVPAYVRVDLGADAWLRLTIEDARAMVAGLVTVLAEHDAVTARVDLVKAAA